MSDRVLTWFIGAVEGDGTSQGPSYVLDDDYEPVACFLIGKQAADKNGVEVDIKADGVSIFDTRPTLDQGETNNEAFGDDFTGASGHLGEDSVVTLDVLTGGAGITVSLELDRLESDEQ